MLTCTSLLRQAPPGAQAAAERSSGVCSTSSRGLDDLLPLGAYQAKGRSRAKLSRRESSALFAGFARAANCPGLLAMEDLDPTHPAESVVSMSATQAASQATSPFLSAEEGGLHARAANSPGRLAMEDLARSPGTEAEAPATEPARQGASPSLCAKNRCLQARAAVSPSRLAMEDIARSTRTKGAPAPSAGQAASLFLDAERTQLQGLPEAAGLSRGTEKQRWDGLPEQADQSATALGSGLAARASAEEPNGATWPDQPAKAGDAFDSLQVRGHDWVTATGSGWVLLFSQVHLTAQMQQQQALQCRLPCWLPLVAGVICHCSPRHRVPCRLSLCC